MQTHIDLPFGDGTYTFRLPLVLVNELQRKTGSGIGSLFSRVLRGRYVDKEGSGFGMPMEASYSAADVLEPIRLGLIGGNHGVVNGEHVQVDAIVAQSLMDAYCYPARPLADAWTLAASILMACVEGYEEPDQKKSADEAPDSETGTAATPKDGSTIHAPLGTSPLPEPPLSMRDT